MGKIKIYFCILFLFLSFIGFTVADLSCIENICLLSDDESSIINGETIEIVSIDSDKAELKIGSVYTGDLVEGDSFSTEKNEIVINYILYNQKTNGISKIEFESKVEHDISPSAPAEGKYCMDSDNGESPFKKGYILHYFSDNFEYPEHVVETDMCHLEEDWKLTEFYCDSEVSSGYGQKVIECEYGCVDGACLDENFLEEYPENYFSRDNFVERCYSADYCSKDYYAREGVSFCYENYCVIYNEANLMINGVNVELSCGKWFEDCRDEGGGHLSTSADIFIDGNKQRVYDGEIINIKNKKYMIKVDRNLRVIFNSDIEPFYDFDYKFNCIDSDGGINIFQKGTAIYPNSEFSYSDNCEDEFSLSEVLCLDDNSPAIIQTHLRNYYVCPENTRCEDGACVRSKPGLDVQKVFGFDIDNLTENEEVETIDVENFTEEDNLSEESEIENLTTENEESLGTNQTKDSSPNECNGCLVGGKCYAIGYREAGEYCNKNQERASQLEKGNSCENSFECVSNVCVSGECVDEGLIRKILNWLKGLFE